MTRHKTLKNLLIGSSIFTLSLFSNKLLSQDISKTEFYSNFKTTKEQTYDTIFINPHIQPNDSALNWYGSGDINKDNTLNWNDYYDLEDLINKTYPKTDIRLKDRADINGDRIINSTDQEILKGFLDGSLKYLPSHWNNLLDSERINWFEKILEIDWQTPINVDMNNWRCEDYTRQFIINTQGTTGDEIYSSFVKYDFTHKGRFNLPVFGLYLANDSTKFYHRVNAILIGNNARDFKNWYIMEPQAHKKYELEKDPRMEGGDAYLGYIRTDKHDVFAFLKFKIENQKAILVADSGFSIYPIKLIEARDTTNLRATPLYTSLEKQIIQNNTILDFYPNPVSGIGTFGFKENSFEERNIGTFGFKENSFENSKLKIYDVYGKKKFEKITDSEETEIDFSDYPAGVYFYRITGKNKEISTGKIIKQ